MQSILSFIVLLVIVLLVAAFGMWAAQGIGARLGRKGPSDPENRAAAPLSGNSAVSHHPSPDGLHDVVTAANEVRPGHWVETPSLIECESQSAWFALDARWSADVITWASDSQSVTIKLRKYPGDVPGLTLIADIAGQQARMITRGGTESMLLPDVESWLDLYIRRFGVALA